MHAIYDILSLWRRNVDLQYVINEIATVKYVCRGMTKGEKGMGKTLKRVAEECRNDAVRTQMNKIKDRIPCQASIGGTGISNASVTKVAYEENQEVLSVNTSMKDEHVSLPKSKSQLAHLHDDHEDVFATSIIDRYDVRPHALQNICLATFAVKYDVIQSSTQTGETLDVNTEEDMQNTENAHALKRMKIQKKKG